MNTDLFFFFFFPVEMGNRLSPSKRSKPCVGWRSEKQGAERPLTQDSLSPQGFTCSPLSTRGAERQPYTCRRPCAIARFCKSPNTSRQCHRRTSFFPLKKKKNKIRRERQRGVASPGCCSLGHRGSLQPSAWQGRSCRIYTHWLSCRSAPQPFCGPTDTPAAAGLPLRG